MEIDRDPMVGAAAGADMQPEPYETLAEEPRDAVEEYVAHVDVAMSEVSGEGASDTGVKRNVLCRQTVSGCRTFR